MKRQLQQRRNGPKTPSSKIMNIETDHDRSLTSQTLPQHSSLRTKAYSFQDIAQDSFTDFCMQVCEVSSLLKTGKRITDPNVLLLNSTQKQMVEMIIDNNKGAKDEKSRFLTQRAGKYIKILWKSEKYNDQIMSRNAKNAKVEKSEPRYASPIHNFRKSKPSKSQEKGQTRSQKSLDVNVPKIKQQAVSRQVSISKQATSRAKYSESEDERFVNVKINKAQRKRTPSKARDKSVQSEGSSIARKTISTTRNFENMLKILKKAE